MSAAPETAPAAAQAEGLDERAIALLDFERRWVERRGAKEAAVRAELGLTAPRYYQLLYALIDTPAALAHDPMLVRRLQRIREARTQARAVRRFGGGRSTDQDDTH
ncbi:DUF3263 domain-containing protein [Homoserinibacter sp. YIM 151385]|uniref:DUF3263 domain-containing protein n=1 Tax=Homoserinibacter sp. YIM 151385 TaxID=2985506 RepID=UPI0022F0984A|nr:DUF3263 domain-containing protein [Homoserinibacter sp. YIM 151385]WBU37852.1 DUF3263 domain-containing protein [Homoserinibacter sp. YIM 151385]